MSRYYRALLVGGCVGLIYFAMTFLIDFIAWGKHPEVFGLFTAALSLPGTLIINSDILPNSIENSSVALFSILAGTDITVGAIIFLIMEWFESMQKSCV
jgi:hypothetical protein